MYVSLGVKYCFRKNGIMYDNAYKEQHDYPK